MHLLLRERHSLEYLMQTVELLNKYSMIYSFSCFLSKKKNITREKMKTQNNVNIEWLHGFNSDDGQFLV